MISPDLAGRLELELYSEAEQRIPFASKQRFINALLREYFERKKLDLSAHFPELPPGSIVYGPRGHIETLQEALEAK